MKNRLELLNVVEEQFSIDYNFEVEDLCKEDNIIVKSASNEGQRINGSNECFFKVLYFKNKLIISAEKEILKWSKEKFIKCNGEWFSEYENLRNIDEKLKEYGHEIADIHHYYLPKMDMPEIQPITNIKWFEYEDIFQFKGDNRFNEALLFSEKCPDVLAIAAMENDSIMGMAGATKDSETMWQIGINVIPEYRGKGIGANLVALLKQEILRRGKVPFYGTVESHINSQNVAIKAGFIPAWIEIYSKKKKMNNI